jgi:hypothetical protein
VPDLERLRGDFDKRYEAALATLRREQAHFGGKADQHIARLRAAREAAKAMDPKVPAAEQRQPLVTLNAELAGVVEHIVGLSGLALDPEGDSYYVMLIAMVDMPDLMESLGQTRAALATLALDGISPATVAPAAASLAGGQAVVARIERSFERAVEFNPDLKRLKLNEALQSTAAFRKTAEAALGGGPGGPGAQGWMTPDEVRRRFNLPPLPNGEGAKLAGAGKAAEPAKPADPTAVGSAGLAGSAAFPAPASFAPSPFGRGGKLKRRRTSSGVIQPCAPGPPGPPPRAASAVFLKAAVLCKASLSFKRFRSGLNSTARSKLRSIRATTAWPPARDAAAGATVAGEMPSRASVASAARVCPKDSIKSGMSTMAISIT